MFYIDLIVFIEPPYCYDSSVKSIEHIDTSGTRLTKGSGTPGTSGSKVPSYPRYLGVYTRGFLTPEVRTPEVVVWTWDFPEVPKTRG